MLKKIIIFLFLCLFVYLYIMQIVPMGIAILRTSVGFIFDFPNYQDYWFDSIELDENTSSWQVTYKNEAKEKVTIDAEPSLLPVLAGQKYQDLKMLYQRVEKNKEEGITDILENAIDVKGSSYRNNVNNTNASSSSSSNVTKSSDAVYNLNRD